ncbi:alpha/beta fold hydrolase [Hymenobacter sp. M29]|uniref:Alpha/beta fold hydrolase n=1 Tax=Hymenobacter mellowenesis TaxID=3063995 RepID=A0ABT9A4U6_9BACT|nr:alpha/beta fold hydrolase [Hymenobacter sp. M29]MDO7844860.1 alpha/beta fold hydrolase [Hymenobacter sp. M29]
MANTRPVTNWPGLWDQYEQARALTPAVVARLDSAYGGRARIFAVGHSLGGGLAQHAGYTCPRIEKVFAFNSSPLTGYFDLARKERLFHGSRRRTFLIYESYEVLALFRAVPSYLDRFRNLDIVVVRYNFTTGLDSPSPFRQHAMQRLVAGLDAQK